MDPPETSKDPQGTPKGSVRSPNGQSWTPKGPQRIPKAPFGGLQRSSFGALGPTHNFLKTLEKLIMLFSQLGQLSVDFEGSQNMGDPPKVTFEEVARAFTVLSHFCTFAKK